MPPELPKDRSLNDDEMQEAIIYVLLNPGSYQPGIQNFGEVVERLGGRIGSEGADLVRMSGGSESLQMRFLAIVWRWVSVGLLVPRGPAFHLAPGARQLFEDRADEADIVLRRSGLVARLRERCPGLDSITERYAAYAQESFLAGHYQSAAVMIGVASESALLYFTSRCERILGFFGISKRRRRSDNAIELLRWIEDVANQHRKALIQAVEQGGGEQWIDDLPGLLGIATGIRLNRNEAGHPAPHEVSRDECRSMLGLFPRFAEALFVSAAAFDRITDAASTLNVDKSDA